ncbi:PPA1309 family protein [Jonesiaceae bacterium BS-20]|uniref:PPA1309 family protein n=1 Tax=Jonesiaceae bacterium BS-20 TaxID=3120821 RepID=A0AAU7DZ52_9MICO
MTRPIASNLSTRQRSLADAVSEIERHVSSGGWDGPIRVFALIATQEALAADPDLAQQLPAQTVEIALADPEHLTSVEQEDLPAAESLEDLLGSIQWPVTVVGCAVVTERVILPPSAEEELPSDPTAALTYVNNHPDRQDVRMAVGVMRSGETWCAIRTRDNDSDTDVAHGPNLVPGLIAAVTSTLE